MAKILMHMTRGPGDPTTAALGFLVARTALDEGHEVDVFLAGDGVELVTGGNLESVEGRGTGKLQEHFDAIVSSGGRFHLSKMSSDARGIGDEDIAGMPAAFAKPTDLLRLSLEADRMFTY